MTLADLAGATALLALTAYAVLAGADFGGGVWDLVAMGPRKGAQREAIAHAMGPVWEANHVWLIFAIVLLFACFPPAYAALGVGLFAPLHLALAGIVLRGASFVFRAYGNRDPRVRGRWGAVFGASSVVTPVLLGQCLGAVSTGALRGEGVAVHADGVAWMSPVSLAIGLLTLAACAYTAAVFLTLETEGELRDDFRARALGAGTAVVALSALVVPLLLRDAPHLAQGLLGPRAAPVVAAGVVAALASGAALRARRYRLARVTSVVWVALEVVGWGIAQHPYLIYPDVTLAGAAAPDATLRFVLASAPVGAALLAPSLWLLFRVFKGRDAMPPADVEGASHDA